MARSIKDMKKNSQSKQSANQGIGMPPDGFDNSKVTPELERDVNDLINRYSGKSDSELMNELKRVTSQQRQSGMLDTAQIDAAANSILPMLNAEQAQKLQSILAQIR